MSVYGKVNNNDELNLCNEKTICEPQSFYAVGKLASENYMKIYSNLGINCTALRLFNVYGEGQNMDNLRQGMASIFLSQAINDRKILVKGSGERFRDFVHVDDVTDAFILASKVNLKNNFNVFNISTSIKTTVQEIIELIQKNFNYKIPVTFKGNTPGDIYGITGDHNKFSFKTNWKPQLTFDKAFKKMINYYK